MKKLVTLFLSTMLVFSLASCGDSDNKTQSSIGDSKEILITVWDSYSDDEKFPAAGGDMSEENMTMDGPGSFGLEDADTLDSMLGFPAGSADKLVDAASIMHMMNANTFTCGVYHVTNADDVSDLTTAIKDNILQRQWLCGFPDKLVIVTIDNYIVAFFGETEIVDTFQTKLTESYSSAQVVCDEPIA